jgi:two-component system cell cycle response regulator
MTSPALRVLIVSGDPIVASSLEHVLARAPGTWMRRATTVAGAVARLAEESLDAVLVDLAMTDGSELADLTRVGRPEPLAVLGILRQDCPLRTAEALQAGAQECLLLSDLTADRLVRSIRQGIERQRLQTRLADLALRDELTGLYNRRGLLAIGEHARRQCLRSSRSFALVQIDMDGLKTINDTFGHAAGDQAIAATAAILRCTFRESDIVARLGGDEFVAIALDADHHAATRVVVRMEEALAQHNARTAAPFTVAFSAGTAVLMPPERPTLADLLADADRALYANKRRCRQPHWVPRTAPAVLAPTIAA